MDDADKTSEREDITIREAIRASKRPTGPVATGRCLWCDEVVGELVRWCEPECRENWEQEQRFKR